ncbi:alpha/beta fold hydrolase [Xanthomonas sp. NCPPB 2654]|uniref:thioesterase II family protein n=1 Tax=unclassified Xanthomonas TaxID=2643310 RepID=UPI0021E0321A|nr:MULTISPECIES: alpha/beta fold hydrolase [unclassified Xanthomonas]MDL5365579.1 alpha/beta fold hydrolase [Xanthomonas sp. NCPPB 2654]UYC18800.1 alpha/beta fold hydrolase [Xanthomonas sp. CFBP 8443]
MNSIATMQSPPWLVRIAQQQPSMRLFCFAYAGGSAFSFMPWRSALNPAIEICAVQLPGRGARIAEPPIDSMAALLPAMAPAIAQLGALPFAFFGHSVGALIAFELARYLYLHGVVVPERLFMSGCHAPQFRSPSRQLHTLPDGAFIDELRHYNGTPAEVLESRELMALMLPTIRADFAIAENYRYRPGPLLQIPISVYAGLQEENKGHGQVEGWQKETSADLRTTWFEGGHFFINSERGAVLEQLDAELLELLGAIGGKRVAQPYPGNDAGGRKSLG